MKVSIISGFLLLLYLAETFAKYAPVQQLSCEESISSAEMTALLNEAKDKHIPKYIPGKHITFDLYTRNNIKNRQVLQTGDVGALEQSNFNPNWPVRIFIPGWSGKSTTCASEAIKDAYLRTGQFNVILVDWSDIALNIEFQWIEKQFVNLAKDVENFILFLQKSTNLKLDNVYLIGHNSGCHIVGQVGKFLKPQKLAAIVALDPSTLRTKGLPADNFLGPNDASYVEVIYTDTSSLVQSNLVLGHATFFPNWGQDQTTCVKAPESQIFFECNSFAAVHYFVESLGYENLFAAIKCPTVQSVFENFDCQCASKKDTCAPDVHMSGEPLKPKSGLFYLSAEAKAPYGLTYVAVHKKEKPSTEIALKIRKLWILIRFEKIKL